MILDVKKLVVQGLNAQPKNVWPVYGTGGSLDRTSYVTSSEIGYCARKIWFDKAALRASAYSPTEGTSAGAEKGDKWGVMQRGHTAERWLVENLHLSSIEELAFAGDLQVSFHNGVQSGTPDGVVTVNGRKWLLEIKSIDPRTNVAKLPKPTHVAQITQNVDLVSVNGIDLDGAILVYVDVADYSKIYVFEFPVSEDFWAAADKLADRADTIMSAKYASELPAEGIYLEHCKYCNHTGACSAVVRDNVKKGMGNDGISESAKRLFG